MTTQEKQDAIDWLLRMAEKVRHMPKAVARLKEIADNLSKQPHEDRN